MNERDRIRRLGVFMGNVIKTDHCWFWRGAVNKCGYGVTALRGGSQLAHRTGWMLMRGQIPVGLMLCHTCDNRRCVNPNHLYIGTHRENMRDASIRGRFGDRRGSANPRAKLTAEIVRAVRSDKTSTNIALARRYGISDVAVRNARRGKTWRHV